MPAAHHLLHEAGVLQAFAIIARQVSAANNVLASFLKSCQGRQ
jgi:hypothetical protein